jgi:DNA polymerase III sliding clamp (beta) subunit (PCNA family)
MKLTLKTLKLQEMVSKAIKGASNNKMIPITSLMAIQWQDGVLTLITTDAANTLKIIDKVEGEEFYVVVQTELFSKLVAKTTTETITLTLKESSLEVKGNGTYNIELPLDEEGQLIKFPDYKFDHKKAEKSVINLSTIKTILTANKAAVAETMEVPCLTGYYFDDKVITTDTFKVCSNEVKVLPRKILLPTDLVELLSIMDEEKVTAEIVKNKILFTTNNVVLYGSELDGIEDYPVEAIEAYVLTEFDSVCKLPKGALLNVLDRLSLFVSEYDKNGVYLTFTTDGVIFSSKRSNGTELIKYQESQNFKAFTCCADIELLKSQVSAQEGEVVEMWYGHEQAIKMVSGKITQIVALLEDDRAMDNGEASES